MMQKKRTTSKSEDYNSTKLLDDICGCWESTSLNPSLIIYKDHSKYLVSVLHIASSGQASPSTYEIKNENDNFFSIRCHGRCEKLEYEKSVDELFLNGYGNYVRRFQNNH